MTATGKLKALRDVAGHARGAIHFRDIQGWLFGLSLGYGGPVEGVILWHLSAQLIPVGRGSVVEDWHFLGEAVQSLGAPDSATLEDVIRVTPPNAIHHWVWSDLDTEHARGVAGRMLDAARQFQTTRAERKT